MDIINRIALTITEYDCKIAIKSEDEKQEWKFAWNDSRYSIIRHYKDEYGWGEKEQYGYLTEFNSLDEFFNTIIEEFKMFCIDRLAILHLTGLLNTRKEIIRLTGMTKAFRSNIKFWKLEAIEPISEYGYIPEYLELSVSPAGIWQEWCYADDEPRTSFTKFEWVSVDSKTDDIYDYLWDVIIDADAGTTFKDHTGKIISKEELIQRIVDSLYLVSWE